MSKNNRSGNQEAQTESNTEQLVVANRTLTFHSQHPRTGEADRVSYVIPGVSGNLVVFKSLFKDGIAPPTLTLDVDLAEPKPVVDKAAEKAARDIERATKLQEKQAASAVKAEEKRVKAEAALAAARKKVAEAAALAEEKNPLGDETKTEDETQA